MKKSRNPVKLSVINIVKACSLSFLPVLFWIGILLIKERELYLFLNIVAIISVCAFIYCMADIRKEWIILEKCDFEAQETCVGRLLKRKRYKKHAGLHLELLRISIILGKYDQSGQEIEILHRLAGRLNNRQKLRLQLLEIEYVISTDESVPLREEWETVERLLEKSDQLRRKERGKIQRSIRLHEYLREEKWEDILRLLEDTGSLLESETIFEQVCMTYARGKSYYGLGRYGEAYDDLKFVAKWGGNTKYVALANELIDKMPERISYENGHTKETLKLKPRMRQKLILLGISGVTVLLFGMACIYCSYGTNIKEAYCKRVLCDKNKLDILYRENIDPYELVILNDGKELAYCLFEKNSEKKYKVMDSFRIDKDVGNRKTELAGLGMTEEEINFFYDSAVKLEIAEIIMGFYKSNEIFHQGDVECVGVSYVPTVENVMVNGNQLCVERIVETDEVQGYFWRVEVDLEEDISVEYMGK